MDFLWQSLGYTNKIAQKYPKNTQITLSDTHTRTQTMSLCALLRHLMLSLFYAKEVYFTLTLLAVFVYLSQWWEIASIHVLYILSVEGLARWLLPLSFWARPSRCKVQIRMKLSYCRSFLVRIEPFFAFVSLVFVHQQQTRHLRT